MKTLKKTLCLVLAVVLVVGVMILPASAATTTAAKESLETKYKEALTVLKAVGIYLGDEGGMRADDPITREEVTAIVARLQATDAVARSYPTTGLTFADCKDLDWSKPYIAYCQDKAIVAGDENGFRPGDNITGYEFAKMLLVAIGFNPAESGFYGDAWAGNVYTTVLKTKLNKDLGAIDWSAPIKRGEVAQLALNALVYTKDGGKVYKVYIPGANGDADDILYNGEDYDQAMLFAQTTGAKVESTDSTRGSLADVMYNGLHKEDDGRDVFMRPTVEWADNKGSVVSYVKTPDAVYNGNYTEAVDKTLTGYTKYYNGAEEPTLVLYDTGIASINGLEVEVYNANKTIVVREAYVAQVGVANANAKTVNLTVYSDDGSEVVKSKQFTVTETNPAYATLTTLDKDAYVAAYVKPGWDLDTTDASVLEVDAFDAPVVTTIKRIDDNRGKKTLSSITITDDVVCKLNNEALLKTDAGMSRKLMTGDPSTRELTVGVATLYTLNGNVLLIDRSSAPNTPAAKTMKFAYCYDIKQVDTTASTGSDNWASEGGYVRPGTNTTSKFMVRLLIIDGTVTNTVEAYITDQVSATFGYQQAKDKYLGKLVSYSVNADGVYTLKDYAPKTGEHSVVHNKAEGKIGGSDVLFDSKTQFLVVTTNTTDPTKPNWKVTAEAYNIYTVPDTTSAKYVYAGIFTADGEHTDVFGAKDVASVVVIIDRNTSSAPTPTNTGTYFVVGNPNATKTRVLIDDKDNYIEYIEYNAVVDGQITKVKVKVKDSVAETEVVEPLGSEVKFVKNPVVKNGYIIGWGDDDLSDNTFTGVSDILNDKVTFGTTSAGSRVDYLASVQVGTLAFQYSTADGSITALVLTDIKANGTATGYILQDDNHTTLSALYLSK